MEALVPAVKKAALAVGGYQHLCQPPVPLGEHGLQKAGGAVVIIHVDLFAVHAVQKVLLLGLQAFLGVLRDKLEGRVGLWHKAGHADGHLHAFALGLVRVCII